ncbi:DUF2513 domain-containing protein [Lactiplantibacillus plantarum]|uniref:DUF2513 domain-containing protein n=1 Tax=Lactiplantibacillus plantarum TaxID=1590 RepID=UPI003896DFA4
MQLKQDCVRYVLLELEEQKFNMIIFGANDTDIATKLADDRFSTDDIRYTLFELFSGGFITAEITKFKTDYLLRVTSITWSGHELLDDIRDTEVWRKTKDVTSSFSSISVSILKNVATAVITGIIKQKTGLPL